ncbi:MAG: contractile injection system tape measure protein, partial [Bacteroidota bacterium]
MKGKHFIGKQLFEVSFGSSRNAYAVQQKLSELFWHKIVPELDLLFGRLISNDEVITMDKIVLDLGEVSLKGDGINAFVNRILALLKEELNTIEFSANFSNTSIGGVGIKRKQPLREHYFDLWLYWLEKGVFPSYVIHPEPDWIEQVLETLALDYKAIRRLEEISKRSPVAVKRLVLQHQPEDLKSLAEVFTGFSQNELLSFLKELSTIFKNENSLKGSIVIRDLEVTFWVHVFDHIIVKGHKKSAFQLCTELLKLPIICTYYPLFKAISNKKSIEYPVLVKVISKAPDIRKNRGMVEASIGLAKEKPKPIIDEIRALESQNPTDSTQFFRNAGVILIHTFLSQFFKKINLLEGKEFKNPESRSRAAVLIHYLATGQEKVPEYELILPKFLCGIPPNVPLDHMLKLTTEEKQEANTLLQAAIDHWGALGNTSPNGLREAFLQREGKLIKEETGWKLYMEQKAQDLLIDRLPWNISLVKFPWMKDLLR